MDSRQSPQADELAHRGQGRSGRWGAPAMCSKGLARRFAIGAWCWALMLGITPWAASAEVDARLPESGMGSWLRRIGRVRLPGENERSHPDVTSVFREVVSSVRPSMVRVLLGSQQIALGFVVRSDGLIATKASELPTEGNLKLECLLHDLTRWSAEIVGRQDDCDLALLRIGKQGLPAVRWHDATTLPVGSWLVSANLDVQPVAIGVVSTPPQASPMPKALLGVRMNQGDGGVRVNQVLPGTGADRAGVRPGDVIARINGQQADSPDTINHVIGTLRPGDKVALVVLREAEPLSLTAILGEKGRLGGSDQADLMDSLGGPLSRRRAGFPAVIPHDSILRPRECGGLVLDLDGQPVGVNIARVSRVSSYALPASVVREACDRMLREFEQNAPQQLPSSAVTAVRNEAVPLASP